MSNWTGPKMFSKDFQKVIPTSFVSLLKEVNQFWKCCTKSCMKKVDHMFQWDFLRVTWLVTWLQYKKPTCRLDTLVIYSNLGPVYMTPVYRDLDLLIIYCYFRGCVYMETGTSWCTGIPVDATEIPVKRDKFCPYKRNIPVHRDEVKWNLKRRATRENLKKKTKRNNIRWDAIYANKISLPFIDKLLSTFPRFFEWNRHIPVYRDHIYPGWDTSWATGTSRFTEII